VLFNISITVIITIALIWLYTYRSGMKTIIWTDTLQTTFMLSTVVLIAYTLMQKMDVNVSSVVSLIADSDYSRMFFFDDWTDKKYFFKQNIVKKIKIVNIFQILVFFRKKIKIQKVIFFTNTLENMRLLPLKRL